ncbi:MAG: Cu(I)-responsive transcriptional regulator [Alphaproteobacteria bacterium]|jgi:Cu(I)-responsive transcriptional regulator|nr:Cu(I)-responsive transcriptional regulator [Alphaproteobacteria bacterium]MDP6816315.1 Cu(I)-responsive transcriptional regulator [Alphaproteobacteria bacterium]
MNISQAAVQSGVSSKAIRYYEGIGLIEPARRSDNGYRDFDDGDVHMLRFVARARGLGFSVIEVAELLALYRDRERASAQVRKVAQGAIRRIEDKVAELQSMGDTLKHLVERCHGDQRPDCPILDDLAGRH